MTGTKTKCPICKSATTERYRPFCSRRCSDLDLGRWLGERYAIPGNEPALGEIPDPDDEPDDSHGR